MESYEHRCLFSMCRVPGFAGEDGLAGTAGKLEGVGRMAGILACPSRHLVQGKSGRGEEEKAA